ncbi:type IV toxin-antitoxin system AbiEi family antitoxin domain-containing protein [Cellulomonas cellasea]|uniref:AbiEi antitoxin N-terminal domain-containing protein n=1 Tax=Cellulomonas cellasea DSM 20118 TaxID=1408250 RepID=A0A0A0BD21_9CELL|nr:type IV toxin-antitoxin system AbiEi family antitoxin domain-containing protein [Cellulomonas cellasea]KGM03241.1 hypothetical protein Q760_07990 [Cellulomonas cellasea DSM 20118]
MAVTIQVLASVSQIAGAQWGLVTTAQAEREGITRLQLARLADAGVLERVDRGVYATTAAPTEHRTLRAAWLALDPARTAEERLADPVAAGVASHTSAAGLHGLGDLLDDTPELTLPHRKQSRRGVRLHRLPLTDADVTLVDGLPTTTEERTVADLLRDGHDLDHVAQIVGQGARRGVIDLDDLTEQVEPVARRYDQPDGRALVEHLLDLVGLSRTALVRMLADSAEGRELVAAGRASALSDLAASFMPEIDTARLFGLDKIAANTFAGIDVGKILGMTELFNITLKPLHDQIAAAVSPQLQSALAITNTPAFRSVLQATQSPAVKAAQQWLGSDVGRQATQAAEEAASRSEGSGGAT